MLQEEEADDMVDTKLSEAFLLGQPLLELLSLSKADDSSLNPLNKSLLCGTLKTLAC